MPFFILATPDGKITQIGSMSAEELAAFEPPGVLVITIEKISDGGFIEFLATHYAREGVVMRRVAMYPALDRPSIAADGTDVATITKLPRPCVITVSGALEVGPVTILDGELQLTSDHPGMLTITVTAEPFYMPWSTTLNAA